MTEAATGNPDTTKTGSAPDNTQQTQQTQTATTGNEPTSQQTTSQTQTQTATTGQQQTTQDTGQTQTQQTGTTQQQTTQQTATTTTGQTQQQVATALNPDHPPKPPAAPNWPDDWRDRMATVGGQKDEALLKMLGRYADPGALAIKLREQDKLISSAKARATTPPENAKPEELSNWRKENGIPDTADGYLKDLGGLVVGEQDKPLVNGFAERMLSKNARPEIVKEAIGFYYEAKEQEAEQRADSDAQAKVTAEDALRKDWGDNFRREVGAIHGLLDSAPMGLKDQILGARLADGTPLGSSPATLKWLNSLAREVNPAATVVPGMGAGALSSINDEIASIEAMLRAPRNTPESDKYWKSEKTQERYRELLTAHAKMGKRAA